MSDIIMVIFFIEGFVIAGLIFGGAWVRAEERACREMDRARKRGVYAIKNTATGATYIGSAARSFAVRWAEHVAYLDQGKHDNAQLQRDWLIYGADAFSFTILVEMNEPKETIVERERSLISLLRRTMPTYLIYNQPGFYKT